MTAQEPRKLGYQCPSCKRVLPTSWQAQEHAWRRHGLRLTKPKAVKP